MRALKDAFGRLCRLASARRCCRPFLRPRQRTLNPPDTGHNEDEEEQITHDGWGKLELAQGVENVSILTRSLCTALCPACCTSYAGTGNEQARGNALRLRGKSHQGAHFCDNAALTRRKMLRPP